MMLHTLDSAFTCCCCLRLSPWLCLSEVQSKEIHRNETRFHSASSDGFQELPNFDFTIGIIVSNAPVLVSISANGGTAVPIAPVAATVVGVVSSRLNIGLLKAPYAERVCAADGERCLFCDGLVKVSHCHCKLTDPTASGTQFLLICGLYAVRP